MARANVFRHGSTNDVSLIGQRSIHFPAPKDKKQEAIDTEAIAMVANFYRTHGDEESYQDIIEVARISPSGLVEEANNIRQENYKKAEGVED